MSKKNETVPTTSKEEKVDEQDVLEDDDFEEFEDESM